MGKVMVDCKHCGARIAAKLGFGGRRTFDTAVIPSHSVTCRKCGKTAVYSKEDMEYEEEGKSADRGQ